MSLIQIDWNPGPGKIRQFGLLFIGFAAIVSTWFQWTGRTPAALVILPTGILLGAAAAVRPQDAGLLVYKAWMCFAFVMGTIVSFAILALLYFGMIAPLGLFFRLRGRDALRLKSSGDSEWLPLSIPEEKTYYERLF